MATERTDVVIVGAGASGGILAAELAKAGMKVVALERGPRHTTADFKSLDELRYFERHAMSATHVWRAPLSGGVPGPHTQGGTRMGNDPKSSVVNRYGQSWDIPNLFITGSSTHPSMSGFNPTLTIQALAYMSADAIANRYMKNPGPLA